MVLKRLPKIIDLVLAVLKIRPCKQGSGSGGNRRRRSPVEYRGNLYVGLYLHKAVRPSCERPASASEGLKGRTYVRMYVQTYRFPLYSTGLRPLQFPPGPMPNKTKI